VNLDIRVCSTGSEFHSLREPWNALMGRSERRSLFLTWEWLEACRQTVFLGARLRIVGCFEGSDLVGAAPLVQRRAWYYGVPVTELSFLGDPLSDRQFFLDAKGDGVATARICEYLATNPFGVDLLRLEQLPLDSPTILIAQRYFSRVEVEQSSELPFVPMAPHWSEFEKRLEPKFRSEMRTRPKVFDSIGEWNLQHVRDSGVSEMLDQISQVELSSAKASRGRAFFGVRENLECIRCFLSLASGAAVVPILSTLSISGRSVAYLLAFLYDDKYHAYNMAYLPEHRKGSPGKYVMHQAIRHAHDCGAGEFDFLRGGFFMKREWKPSIRTNCRCVHFYSAFPGNLLRWAVFKARPRIKARFSSPSKHR